MCMHAVLIRLDLFPKRTEEHEGWEGDKFAWGWGNLSAVEGGAEDGYDPNTWHVWRTLSNIELSALPSLSDSLERLSHIGTSKPQSLPQEHWGLETCMAMSAFYRGTGHPNSDPHACTASTVTQWSIPRVLRMNAFLYHLLHLIL